MFASVHFCWFCENSLPPAEQAANIKAITIRIIFFILSPHPDRRKKKLSDEQRLFVTPSKLFIGRGSVWGPSDRIRPFAADLHRWRLAKPASASGAQGLWTQPGSSKYIRGCES